MSLDWDKILRFIEPGRRDEARKVIEEHYSDVVTNNHPVVEDPPEPSGNRVLRFKADPMTRWIVDVAMSGSGGRLTIHDLWVAFQNKHGGRWSRKKMMRFYREMGYSLCGFGEVFGQRGWL